MNWSESEENARVSPDFNERVKALRDRAKQEDNEELELMCERAIDGSVENMCSTQQQILEARDKCASLIAWEDGEW